ncbi:hypothetical protein J8847_23930, partial [Massilia sp. AB1]|nr:hypothetical protein [Massilia sp. AB1]
MVSKDTRASKSLSICLTALIAAGVFGSAQAAAPDTTRVIVAFKPGAAAKMKSAVAAAKGSVKHEIFGMNAMAIEVPA